MKRKAERDNELRKKPIVFVRPRPRISKIYEGSTEKKEGDWPAISTMQHFLIRRQRLENDLDTAYERILEGRRIREEAERARERVAKHVQRSRARRLRKYAVMQKMIEFF